MTAVTLDSLDLAALLCSKVCHDVISPVGAIVNGLELLEEEKDPEMRNEAIGLIKRSAGTASAKLQFCRLAFGAAGSAGASIDTGDAELVARNLLSDSRTIMKWDAPRLLLPKNKVKLLLNMCLIGAAAIPRGGELAVTISGADDATALKVEATGKTVRVAHGVDTLLRGEAEGGTIDAHGIQAYYTGLVARACGMDIAIQASPEQMSIAANPVAATDAKTDAESLEEASQTAA
ncbi:MAG: histidine phosphotransferase ChpT [Beijerinckiaceae bacterium]